MDGLDRGGDSNEDNIRETAYPIGHVSQVQDLNQRENVETNPCSPMTRTSGRLEQE